MKNSEALSNLEERLTERLNERAGVVELGLTAEAVKRHADDSPAVDLATGRRGRVAFAAAAGLLTALGGVALLGRNGAATRFELASPTTESAGLSTTAAIDVSAPADVLSIVVVEQTPERVASTGAVFDAEFVGRVETGPPNDLLLAEEPQLAGATCVAVGLALGCVADNGAGGFTYGSNEGPDGNVVIESTRRDVAVMAVQGLGIFAAGLPDTVAQVEPLFDDRRYVQVPARGTVAFPIGPSSTFVQLVGLDALGQQIWGTERVGVARTAVLPGAENGERAPVEGVIEELADLLVLNMALSWDMERAVRALEDDDGTAPEPFFQENVLTSGDHELLLSVSVGDPRATGGSSGRGQPFRLEGTARVFVGVDGDEARSVELFDGDRVVYVRSEHPEAALDLEMLVDIAVDVNLALAPAG
ncbi:MAG: hypothetical protein O3C27_15265 [Actinomycetota bacterium]|nr:hypothetical protein [Actinomycetota bacterium]